MHSYLLTDQVVYLVLCERAFSRKLAFLFLEELSAEFKAQYGNRIQSALRPYSFIEFDNFIQKCKKQYTGVFPLATVLYVLYITPPNVMFIRTSQYSCTMLVHVRCASVL